MFQMVTGMPEQPYHCLHCGSNPTNDDGTPKRAVFSSGVDVDWGNSVYTCWECAELIADLIDREPRASYDKLLASYEVLKGQHEELSEEHAVAQEALDKIREGAAARSRVLAQT